MDCPLLPGCPTGMPKLKANILDVAAPLAATLAVGAALYATLVTSTVGVPNPAAAPVAPAAPLVTLKVPTQVVPTFTLYVFVAPLEAL
jgi:hypothetical protein